MHKQNIFPQIIEDYPFLHQLFELQRTLIERKRIHFSIVLLKYDKSNNITYEQFVNQLKTLLRSSDYLFSHSEEQYVVVLLSMSQTSEASFFVNRMRESFAQQNIAVVATIAEVANKRYELDEILQRSSEEVLQIVFPQTDIKIINQFLNKEPVTVKISIVENDEITVSIFLNMLKNIDFGENQLDIRTFHDGLEFIESDWYKSSHNHIIILDDMLSRKNGFEVLQYLRSLPNNQKYLILFISSRVSEDAQLYCFENGADAYFVRPFNLKILETQIKNLLKRLS